MTFSVVSDAEFRKYIHLIYGNMVMNMVLYNMFPKLFIG